MIIEMVAETIPTTKQPENFTNQNEEVPVFENVSRGRQTDLEIDLINTEIVNQQKIVNDVVDRVNKIRHKLGLSGEETDIPAVSLNRQKITKLLEKLNLFSNISEATRRIFGAGIISALFTYGSFAETPNKTTPSGSAEEPGKNNRGEITTTVLVENPTGIDFSKRPQVNFETIRGFVFSDKAEKVFLSKKNEESYFLPNGIVGGGDHVNVPIEEIIKFYEENKINFAIISHTHPLALYSGVEYSDREIKEMQSGKLEPSPMPPSKVDFQGIAQISGYLKEKGVKMDGKIFDATGVWKYKANNENIDLFNKYKELIEQVQKIGIQLAKSFSKEEQESLRKLGNIHQEKTLQVLKQNPETRALAEKFVKFFEKEGGKFAHKYANIIKAMNNIDEITTEISNYYRLKNYHRSGMNPNLVDLSLDELINKYKLEVAKLGFEIEYTPYKK